MDGAATCMGEKRGEALKTKDERLYILFVSISPPVNSCLLSMRLSRSLPLPLFFRFGDSVLIKNNELKHSTNLHIYITRATKGRKGEGARIHAYHSGLSLWVERSTLNFCSISLR